MKRVVLVGCGRQASRAHLPVLDRRRDQACLVAVVDLAEEEEAVRKRCAEFDLDGQMTFLGVSDGRPPPLPPCDAVIVSSPPLTHLAYLRVALAVPGVAVLVDKPVTLRPGARSSAAVARSMVADFGDIITRSDNRVMSAVTQRRYHDLYRRIGLHLHTIHARTGHGVTFVQSLTNDGLWNDSGAHLLEPGSDPSTSSGGKLVNTGYHLLDTVPWLLRHCQRLDDTEADVARIRSADVYAQLFGPEDAVALGAHGAQSDRPAGGPRSEINAGLQIAFRDEEGRTVCLWQLGALHEGISARSRPTSGTGGAHSADAGRTKQDLLTMYQGPVGAVWMRRIAKLVPNEGSELGQSGHADLVFAQNPQVTGASGALEQVVLSYVDADTAPTEEFVDAIGLAGAGRAMVSPVADQAIAVRLLSAAYESAADGRPVRVSFDEGHWRLPPAAASWLLEAPEETGAQ